jgi:hypothetical protein
MKKRTCSVLVILQMQLLGFNGSLLENVDLLICHSFSRPNGTDY